MSEMYLESSNNIPVYGECDILVVGGGAAGHSAAVAAARANRKAKVVLMERYGYFGGDVTGAYVLMIPSLNWRKFPIIRGLQEEWFARLDKTAPDSYMSPTLEQIGLDTPVLVDRWSRVHSCVGRGEGGKKILMRSPNFEPQQLKIEMDLMVQEEPNIELLLHCWGTKPIVEDNTIKGVIFESKAGRQLLKAKIVIDCTGDGDIFAQCGPFHGKDSIFDENQRDNQTALVWRCGGVDYEAYARWSQENPKLSRNLNDEMAKIAGYPTMFFSAGCNHTVWFNNWINGMDCLNLEDIRKTELMVRNSIRDLIAFCKEAIPFAFKDAYLVDVAPQLGVRLSRRLDGEKYLTKSLFVEHPEFDDVIAWSSTGFSDAPLEIPYGCLVSKHTENLLAAGRHISADQMAIGALQLIPQCVQTGQGAGVAAAVAIADGATAHTVDIKKVQYILSHEQNVPLPRQDNTDPELIAALEAMNYGRGGRLPFWMEDDFDPETGFDPDKFEEEVKKKEKQA